MTFVQYLSHRIQIMCLYLSFIPVFQVGGMVMELQLDQKAAKPATNTQDSGSIFVVAKQIFFLGFSAQNKYFHPKCEQVFLCLYLTRL